MRLRLRRLALAAAVITTAGSLAACGASSASTAPRETSSDPAWQKVLDGAYEEGEVNLYNTASDRQNLRIQKAWEEDYPQIELNVTRSGVELPARVSSELETGVPGADVFLWSDPAWFERNEEHLADLSGLPSQEGWSEDFWTIPNKAMVATTLPWSMVVWNTNTFPDGFQTYDDLLDPSVKGQLATRDQVTASIAGYLDFMESTLGEEYLLQLGEQDPKFYSSVIPMMQAVASGEIGVANVGVPSTVLDLKEKGAPIDFAYMEPGFAFEHGGSAFEQAEHRNASLVFMNWLMSEVGQAAYNGEGQGGSGRAGIEGALATEDYTMLDSTAYPPEVLPLWEAKVRRWFG